MNISAVVLTKNEEANIEKCLSSIFWCDEIIVVDDYSEDSTTRLISQISKKAKVYQRHLNRDFAGQRNFGLEKATGDWVLFVDADEVISPQLSGEIKNLMKVHDREKLLKSYLVKRKDFIFGRWLKFGETTNVELLRLARKGNSKWEGKVHEIWKVEGELGELQNPILHYPHPTVSEFLKEVNWYTDLVAQYWKEQGRKIAAWEILLYPVGKFIQNYILRSGFRDGTAGFIMAAFMSFHSFAARSKYWLRNH